MRLVASLLRDLERESQKELERGARAVTVGSRTTIDALKTYLRSVTISNFGSQRLANAWRSDVYPRGGKRSLGASAILFSNAPHIIEAFTAARTIRHTGGFFLAIPSSQAIEMRGAKGERPTPSSIEQRLGLKLQFVYRPGRASLLVADLRRRSGKRGGFAAPTDRTRKTESVVMFVLVPFVRLKQVFDLEKTYSEALDNLVRNIMTEWENADA